MSDNFLKPDYLFEVSWAVCNKTSNEHNVIRTKAETLSKLFGDKYICFGPDISRVKDEYNGFVEDELLFKAWRKKAKKDNINIRIGRWNIPGQPIAIMVDFTPLFALQDKILSDFWSKFGLDSLTGGLDYVEKVMFGYAVGQAIENFYQYYFSSHDRFAAIFNDWKSGAGLLYLNDKLPQAAKIFSVNNTIIGKSLTGQGISVQNELHNIVPSEKAKELNILSNYSLECLAAQNTDAFIAADDIINNECKKFLNREADIIAPYVFENSEEKSDKAINSTLETLINKLYKAFEIALKKVDSRKDLFKDKTQYADKQELEIDETQCQVWEKFLVKNNIPVELKELESLSKNIWWSWNYQATELFEWIDPELWQKCEKNPVRLLENLTTDHYRVLINNDDFMALYGKVVDMFNKYMQEGKNKSNKQIAYFSMEYGLHESIKIYSGGLGVLAGDYLKQASDDNINLVSVGLLYRYGYFSQSLSAEGEQLSNYFPHNFYYMSAVPVKNDAGDSIKVKIDLPGRTLSAKVWKIDVGRIPLYLLDTDIPENETYDRAITYQLYGGNNENRLKQEILLGVGGIRLLDAIGLKPGIYHCNEGHAAFTGLERLRKYIQNEKLSFNEALEIVKASGLFTTHTPVPAGHDYFSEDMLQAFMPHYAERLGITWETFINLGKMNKGNPDERFSMSVLAANLSQEINGVSEIHGRVSREMFADLYPGYFTEETPIGYVTNGVHYSTWTAKEWQKLHTDHFGEHFLKDCSDPKSWEKIYNVSDELIWEKRNYHRKLLFDYIKNRILSNLPYYNQSPKELYKIIEALDENALTIGFARRFAPYKRANLLFNDPEKLSRIVNMENMPVLFIFSGKAHPENQEGQDLIKKITEYSNKKEFRGKIIFLEDYDMELARYLVQGVDIWLNTPTRPMEASGTSGQKAALNGVLNFSILDGWWAEGYVPEAGWCIKEKITYKNQALQNELDASVIYNLLENEIIPKFYKRNDDNIPYEWVSWIKNCIAKVAPEYTNKRMLDDYINHFYKRNFDFSEKLIDNNYAKAKELSLWKKSIENSWDNIEIKSKEIINNFDKALLLGEHFVAEITIDLKDLSPDDIGLETIFIQKSFDEKDDIYSIHSMEQVKSENNHVTFRIDVPVNKPGIYNYAFRMFPKHELLAYKQDLRLIRYL